MSDWQSLLFAGLAVTGLAYCLWKTQQDWEQSGLGWRVAWGIAASLSAFIVVALLFAMSVLRNL